MHKNLHSRMQGTAIFMALLMIAIVAGMASVLMRMQHIDIRRTQMMLTSEQSYLYAQGVIDWAKGALKADLRDPGATIWPMVLSPTSIANGTGTIAGTLQDAQGLFNINVYSATAGQQGSQQDFGIVLPPDQQNSAQVYQKAMQAAQAGGSGQKNNKILFNLLGLLGIEMNEENQQHLVSAIAAWVSRPPGSVNNTDSYDEYYGSVNPPYRAPHALMANASELRIVSGMTPAMFNKLQPYIIALPEGANFNPAHAPPLLQRAAGYNPQSGQSAAQSPSGKYFLLRADVYLNDQHLVLYTLLMRSNKQQKIQVSQLWQSFGTA